MVQGFFMFIARLCIAAIFFAAAYYKFVFYDATFQYMASKNLPMIPILLVGAGIVELIGALSLVFGYKARAGAVLLMLFLIPTTYLFHDFWNMEGADREINMLMFLKNIAIFGGLLYIASVGAGRWACDSCCSSLCRLSKEETHAAARKDETGSQT